MKATGIIRRIDDLGKVVIPKEIRRKLRIRENDPLEISINTEGEVVLRKYSPVGELSNSAQYAGILNKNTGHIAMIADRDVIIAAAGAKEFINKAIGPAVERALEERTTFVYEVQVSDDENLHVIQTDGQEYTIKSQVIAPIITQGDPIGAVIIVSKEAEVKLGDLEIKLAETAAGFLAKQME